MPCFSFFCYLFGCRVAVMSFYLSKRLNSIGEGDHAITLNAKMTFIAFSARSHFNLHLIRPFFSCLIRMSFLDLSRVRRISPYCWASSLSIGRGTLGPIILVQRLQTQEVIFIICRRLLTQWFIIGLVAL
jgi:hypothetical protein